MSRSVALGVGGGIATAALLNEANQAYERKQATLTGIDGDCSSTPCRDNLVCYKNICMSSLPKDGCIKDSGCRLNLGQKCVNGICVDTMSQEEKEKKMQEQSNVLMIIGIIVGVLVLLSIIYVMYIQYKS
jgi:hypothetical protein